MITAYKTITSVTEGLYKEKGSKFIAIARPANTIEEVEEQLNAIRKQYHDARHHCYAYVIGLEGELFRANDDGEPGHSAGDPILGQIRSFELTNTLVVVVRYFGGTKLGVSGLINAYKTAAREALSKAHIITRQITKHIVLEFPYPSTNNTMKLIGDFQIKITRQNFDDHCLIEGEIPVGQVDNLITKVELLNNLGTELKVIIV